MSCGWGTSRRRTANSTTAASARLRAPLEPESANARAASAKLACARSTARGYARRGGITAADRGARPAPGHIASTTVVPLMGDTQRLSPDEQLRLARERFEQGDDFTVAVEEEFALLDPGTLSLVNRFEDVQAAAQGTPLQPHLAGALIGAHGEGATGRGAAV